MVGGTANNYVYTLDPINSSDYSGNACYSWGCTLGGGYMQGGSIGVNQLQPAAPVQSYQPAAGGFQAPNNSYRINTSPARGTGTAKIGALPPRNNSTAMPVAKMAGKSFMGAPYAPPRNALSNTGSGDQYAELSASACLMICIEGSLGRDTSGGIHPSIGIALGAEVGFSSGIGGGPGRISSGAYGKASCSWGLFTAGATTSRSGNGYFGGLNFVPAELGCSAGVGYTF